MKHFISIALTASFLLPYVSLAKEKFIPIFLPNGKKIIAELALNDEQRQRGLMFRKNINKDQGMLFIFKEEGLYSFWMKNMSFPIDILWLNKEKRIVHIEQGVPPCQKIPCPSYVSKNPALYVLELKAGTVEENAIQLYDRIDFILY